MSDNLSNIFDVSARAMSAQMVRLNTVASNLANANNIASSEAQAYRAIKPVFSSIFAENFEKTGLSSVQVDEIIKTGLAPSMEYKPDHPSANNDGYIFKSAVDTDEELIEMLDASRNFQNNIEVITTLRSLMLRTIDMGK